MKPPVWTWEVPAYLFVGGVAGISAVVALMAELTGNSDPTLARDARYVALAGALISPLFLISDLGRPSRFLYMLRVFKPQSAMSVGAWTLAVFGGAITGSILFRALLPEPGDSWHLAAMVVGFDVVSALTGLVLVTYTGVLLGATAIPVWAANARVLPWLFMATSLGAAASLLELIGHQAGSLHALAITGAAVEVIGGFKTKGLTRRTRMMRTAELLAGGVPLVLRLLVPIWAPARTLAGVSAIAGGALARIAWIEAGRTSATENAPT